MLATLFDFPLEDRHLLTHWSNIATAIKDVDPNAPTREERMAELHKMAAYFTRLWNERVNTSPGSDLISMMAHNPETRNMSPQEGP
jgi:cytochrome P450